jgi:hypothetical protein
VAEISPAALMTAPSNCAHAAYLEAGGGTLSPEGHLKDIETAWEPTSVWIIRSGLAIAHFGVLACLNLAIGLHLKKESAPIVAPAPSP